MSCSLNKNKFVGSGYRKSDVNPQSELDLKMAKMLEERSKQDRTLFPLNDSSTNTANPDNSQSSLEEMYSITSFVGGEEKKGGQEGKESKEGKEGKEKKETNTIVFHNK